MADKKISELTEASPLDGTEDLPLVQAGTTVRTSTQDIADLAIKTATVSVSSAEILALNGTPKQLVAAPGAGKILVPIAVTYKFTYGSAAYTTNLNLRLRMGFTLTQNAGILGLSGNAYAMQPLAGGVVSSDVSNTAITLDVATGDPAAGNGTMIVYVSYVTITL